VGTQQFPLSFFQEHDFKSIFLICGAKTTEKTVINQRAGNCWWVPVGVFDA
jgi:hypothetical protein